MSHLVLRRGDEVVGIAQLRIIRPTPFDCGIAYLRWGPIWEPCRGEVDPEALTQLFHALQREYVSKRKLLLQVVPNAFVGSERAKALEDAFAAFNFERCAQLGGYRTLLLDMSRPTVELRRQLDKKWRNQLSRAERNDLKVISGTEEDKLLSFCVIYKEMKRRKGFETTVDVDEFLKMQSRLEESQRLRTFICEGTSGPVAGLVVSVIGDSAIYLLGATSDSGLDSKGAYLLQWTLILWLKEKQVRYYDLGGIDPEGNPGVYHFKRGLGGVDSTQLPAVAACDNALSLVVARIGWAVHYSRRRIGRFSFSSIV